MTPVRTVSPHMIFTDLTPRRLICHMMTVTMQQHWSPNARVRGCSCVLLIAQLRDASLSHKSACMCEFSHSYPSSDLLLFCPNAPAVLSVQFLGVLSFQVPCLKQTHFTKVLLALPLFTMGNSTHGCQRKAKLHNCLCASDLT